MINSPFVNSHNTNLYNRIKICFFIFSGIAFLRFILFIIISCISSLLFNLFLIGFKSKDENGNFLNISPIRRLFLYIPQMCVRIGLFILGFYSFEDNINQFFKFNYLERDNAPKLIIANHVSFIDTFYFTVRGLPTPVVAYNVLKIPIVGSAFKKIGPIVIPINNLQKKLVPEPKKQITERLTHPSIKNINRPLIIFPEGSTKNSKFLLKFQKGAFIDKVIYQPVLLNYDFKYVDPSWTIDSKDYILLFLMCCQFENKLKVTYLEPTNLPAEEIRKVYISKLNLIDSNFSNHDNNILKHNYDKKDYIYNHIFQNGIMTMEYYKTMINISSSSFSKLINKFYDLDTHKVGLINSNKLNELFESIYLNDEDLYNIVLDDKIINFNDAIRIWTS
jgi:1-acyl-sn-glycerol-3-phosphate acyltransferase